MATRTRSIDKLVDNENGKDSLKPATAQCLKRLGVLITYLRQAKHLTLGVQHVTVLRKAFPNLPKEEDLDFMTLESFAEKLATFSPDKEQLTPSAIQRWEASETLPSVVNMFSIATIAQSTVQELFDYLLEGYIEPVAKQLTDNEVPLLLNAVRTQNETTVVAEIIKAGAQRILELQGKIKEPEILPPKTIEVSPEQREKLAKVLKDSLQKGYTDIPQDIGKFVLEVNQTIKYNEQTLKIIAKACCKIDDWGKKSNIPLLNYEENYAGNYEQLLADLNGES